MAELTGNTQTKQVQGTTSDPVSQISTSHARTEIEKSMSKSPNPDDRNDIHEGEHYDVYENNDQTTPESERIIGGEQSEDLTAVLIMRIPYNVKREQILQLITNLNLPLPDALDYQYNKYNRGLFRGLAIAKFDSPEQSAQFIEGLNDYELQGHKLHVLYAHLHPRRANKAIASIQEPQA